MLICMLHNVLVNSFGQLGIELLLIIRNFLGKICIAQIRYVLFLHSWLQPVFLSLNDLGLWEVLTYATRNSRTIMLTERP